MKIRDKIFYRANESIIWAKARHEIVKYKPEKYNGSVYSDREEWTSFCDIGDKLTYEEYLDTENRYVNVAKEICDAANCKYMTIVGLENHIDNKDYKKARKYDRLSHTTLSTSLLDMSANLTEGRRLNMETFSLVIRAVLRQHIFAFLVNESKHVCFDFTENYYMRVNCKTIGLQRLQNIVNPKGLYLNPREKHFIIVHDNSIDVWDIPEIDSDKDH